MRVNYCLATPAAAKHCGVSAALFEKLRCVGGGAIFCRLGRGRGRIVYRVSDLDDWLRSNRRRSTSDPGGDLGGEEQAEGPGDAEGPPARRRSTNDPGDEEQEEEDPDEASPSV